MERLAPLGGVRRRLPAAQRGTALAMALHVLLLLLVLGQLVYLASRHRLRIDLTSDRLWSLTDSTRDLLGKLEQQLVVEAYVSPKDKLPVNLRESRAVLDNFLDEMVQLGRGKVVVQRFDPNSDKAIAERCQRIGVQPLDLRNTTATSVSFDRHWQGLRLVYGGDKQKVLGQLAPPSSFVAEAQLTPAVKEVVTQQKRTFGFMEWPAQAIGQQQPGGIGWNYLRTLEPIAKRYEFQNVKDEDGALLPESLDTLFLFRPKDLTDRQKYVLDQFLLRGGTLVVFADAAEYAIGPQRQFTQLPFQLDAAGSQKPFLDQLRHYGVDWKFKVLADIAQETHTPRDRLSQAFEYYAVPQMTQLGQMMAWVPYPYFFHAMAGDWSRAAEQLARDERGQVDQELAARYRKLFLAGMPSDDFLFKPFKQIGRGPGFYWPTWVGLRQKAGGVEDLPEGVTGRVLLWSSPAVLAEDPPRSLDPLGYGDPQTRQLQHTKFMAKLMERFRAEPRQQAPLMVDVRGRFASFFAGGERPLRPSEAKEKEAKQAAGETKPGETAPVAKPEDVGPQPPVDAKPDAAAPPPEPAMLAAASRPGRLVVLGDADFVRDDLVRGDHRQAGGPVSVNGPAFFNQLLDWLAEDQDLVALQSRVPTDRTLQLVAADASAQANPLQQEQAVAQRTRTLKLLNVLVPPLLLSLFGLAVFLIRRAQKRAFLASLS